MAEILGDVEEAPVPKAAAPKKADYWDAIEKTLDFPSRFVQYGIGQGADLGVSIAQLLRKENPFDADAKKNPDFAKLKDLVDALPWTDTKAEDVVKPVEMIERGLGKDVIQNPETQKWVNVAADIVTPGIGAVKNMAKAGSKAAKSLRFWPTMKNAGVRWFEAPFLKASRAVKEFAPEGARPVAEQLIEKGVPLPGIPKPFITSEGGYRRAAQALKEKTGNEINAIIKQLDESPKALGKPWEEYFKPAYNKADELAKSVDDDIRASAAGARDYLDRTLKNATGGGPTTTPHQYLRSGVAVQNPGLGGYVPKANTQLGVRNVINYPTAGNPKASDLQKLKTDIYEKLTDAAYKDTTKATKESTKVQKELARSLRQGIEDIGEQVAPGLGENVAKKNLDFAGAHIGNKAIQRQYLNPPSGKWGLLNDLATSVFTVPGAAMAQYGRVSPWLGMGSAIPDMFRPAKQPKKEYKLLPEPEPDLGPGF